MVQNGNAMKNKEVLNTLLLVILPIVVVIVIYITVIGHSQLNLLLSESLDGSYSEKRQNIMNLKLFFLIFTLIGIALLVFYKSKLSLLLLCSITCLFLFNEYFLDLVASKNDFAHSGSNGTAAIPLFFLMFVFQVIVGIIYYKKKTK